MINLKVLHLSNNMIKFLSPKTFEIPGGKLKIVRSGPKACLNGWYGMERNLKDLEANIKARCAAK